MPRGPGGISKNLEGYRPAHACLKSGRSRSGAANQTPLLPTATLSTNPARNSQSLWTRPEQLAIRGVRPFSTWSMATPNCIPEKGEVDGREPSGPLRATPSRPVSVP
jgi:hypothetical protein